MNAIVLRGDARSLPLPDASVDLIVTSPPYFGLRSYTDGGEHYEGQIGSEATLAEWVAALVACTAEWMRVLKPSGSMFVNLGDKYHGKQPGDYSRDTQPFDHQLGDRSHRLTAQSQRGARSVSWGDAQPKSLLGLPWRYALACTDQLGLILRRDIIWAKPNGLPESVTDRCRSSHEYLFHMTLQPRYYAAVDEIREAHTGQRDPATFRRTGANGADPASTKWAAAGMRNVANETQHGRDYNPLGKLPGSVWDIPSQPLTVPPHLGVDHFAAFPMELPRRCVLGWSPPGVCVECGEGRRPVVDKHLTHTQKIHNIRLGNVSGNKEATFGAPLPGFTTATITGYACACPTPDAPTRPAIVLDPFGGTGTTALVASMHGRTGVSVDRSADYTRLARWRTTDPGERAKALQVPKPPPVPDGMEALF